MDLFMSVYPLIKEDILEYSKELPEFVNIWVEKLRPHASQDELVEACILGWLIEIVTIFNVLTKMQASFLVADDVMDSSETRRGQPCWYKVDGVGLTAINDSYLLYTSIKLILRKRFRNHPKYIDLFEIFDGISYSTILGQLLDMQTSLNSKKFENFDMKRYTDIVTYKTSYYSFYLPIKLALIYDDYLDCFGDPKVIGKVGTDIQENKCSWLIVKALEENYGSQDVDKVAKVKQIYRDLNVPTIFKEFEEKSFQFIKEKIQTLVNEENGIPKEIFTKNMAFRIDNPIEQIPKFKKRPFFVSLGVESPLNLRMKRVEHNANNILNDETPWGSILSSCQVIVVNNGSLEDLWTCIDSIDILDPKWIRPPWDSYFMQLAELASHRSNCMKRRVGAVLVKNSIIMATGYNGTPRYYPNCLDGYCARCNDADVKCGQKLDECFCLHAEENALLEAGRDRANGGTIYCNTCPCIGCAKKIAQVDTEVVVALSQVLAGEKIFFALFSAYSRSVSRGRSVSRSRRRNRSYSRSSSYSTSRSRSRSPRYRKRERSKSPVPPPSYKLAVYCLSRNVTQDHLKEIFGNVIDFDCIYEAGISRGSAYIEFSSQDEVDKAIKYMNGVKNCVCARKGQLDGNVLECKVAVPFTKNIERRDVRGSYSKPNTHISAVDADILEVEADLPFVADRAALLKEDAQVHLEQDIDLDQDLHIKENIHLHVHAHALGVAQFLVLLQEIVLLVVEDQEVQLDAAEIIK
ncbi:Polyprenyl synthetase domain-containing protein [Rozella allomycis CSF55]|uniref:Polyprenyl synthetase domain-containing protein n=2 Tax=Eukaryota TaxID=2759 RepID=A0A075ARZ9_ROZAC|nr:Polyprenyl synthetase domain-containing protein [Rozella allomycis CSF55]|eukprot:EPZ33046.1 Polyprenyl synthetase domain-containing protein [Rozella allomycis CSF55]